MMSKSLTTQNAVPQKKPALKVGGSVSAIVPQDAEQAFRMAKLICESGIAPSGMQRPEQVVTAIFHGLEVGLKPMQAIQSIAVINGRPTVWGDAALGMVQASGLLEMFEEIIEGEGENMGAICRAQRAGNPCPIERRFTVADAETAHLWKKKGPWSQYPKRMLQMRARSWVLRDGFADVLKGLSVAEEVRDFAASAIFSKDSHAITAADIEAQAKNEPVQTEGAFDLTALQKEGRDVATLGRGRMTGWWKDLGKDKQKALLPIKDELASIADQADAEALDAAEVAPTEDDPLEDYLPPPSNGSAPAKPTEDVSFS